MAALLKIKQKKINDNNTCINKILIIIAFFCILLALAIIIIIPSAAGYEISLYEAYPFYFWLFILFAFLCGIYILISHAFSNNSSKLWIFGIVIILYTDFLIIFLPFIRGYVTLGRGDVLTHIGYVKDILITGHFPTAGLMGANHYPVIHIICADLSIITGLSPEVLSEIIPGLFTLFYIISIYLIARKITTVWGETLLIMAFGSLLLFAHANIMFAPSVICFYLLPFILFINYKNFSSYQTTAFSIILIFMLLVIPFLHPGEGTIFLFIILIVLNLSKILYKKFSKYSGRTFKTTISNLSIITKFEIILMIIWFAWFTSYSAFSGTIKVVWNWLINEIQTTKAIEYFAIIQKAELSYSDIINLLFRMHGQALIYFLIAFGITGILLKNLFFKEKRLNQSQFDYLLLFILFTILIIIAFFSNILWIEYSREMIYLIFSATILNGLVLYHVCHSWNKKISISILVILLIISTTVGLFNTFPSPIIKESNSQVTAMEITGMTFFLNYRDENLIIDNLGINQKRFADCLFGIQSFPKNIRYLDTNPPDHFNYLENENYGQSYLADRYFVESILSRIAYPKIFPEYRHLWRFTPNDFDYLDNSDVTASRVYLNGEFWVYYIKC